MFGILQHAASAGRRLFGIVGDKVRDWGTTATRVARTLEGHKGNLKSFVSELGSHFSGAGGESAAHLVNKGIEHAPGLVHKVGEKLTQVGHALHPRPF